WTIEASAENETSQAAPNAGVALRHLLRMIAYDAATRTPHEVVARLRPFVDGARLELQRRHDSDGRSDEYARGAAQSLGGAVSGLCHVARFLRRWYSRQHRRASRGRWHRPARTPGAVRVCGTRRAIPFARKRYGAGTRRLHG